jgi:hypothetical protein
VRLSGLLTAWVALLMVWVWLSLLLTAWVALLMVWPVARLTA